ncbi:hypothetical protein OIU77_002256, partial [Salix suchowensis]
MKMERMVACTP